MPANETETSTADTNADTNADANDAEAPKSKGFLWALLDWVISIAFAMTCILLLRRYIVNFYIVPTESMADTLLPADRLLGEKISYRFSSPNRGDIVTFIDPISNRLTYIKRCIAVAGDEVDLINGAVYVNGEYQQESEYTQGRPSYPLPTSDETGVIEYPYTVPEGTIWVMGDNRTNSNDSRYFGPVPLENVSSRAFCVFWPPSRVHGL